MKNIVIASICKNEINNIDKFINSVISADKVYILDTGSTDETYEKLLKLQSKYNNLIVSQKKYKEFQFDVARNDVLSLIKEDRNETIVINIDFDEHFYHNDWKKRLQDFLIEVSNNRPIPKEFFMDCLYMDNSDITLDNKKRVLTCARIFCGENFSYQNGVHETFVYKGSPWLSGDIFLFCNKLIIVHEQDGNKSRQKYIDLGESELNNAKKKKDDFLKGQIELLLIFEYNRNNKGNSKISRMDELYEDVKTLPVDRSFANVWLYNRYKNKKYLEDLLNNLSPDYYDQNIVYLLLKELGINKISKEKLELLKSLFEFNKNYIGEEGFALSEMDLEIEDMLYNNNKNKKPKNKDKKNK